jgi:hypothetical protein
MTRVLVNGQPQYEIQVKDKVYCTMKILSDFGADAIIGRGTRVFKVYDKVDANKVSLALKDVWVEEDRAREGAVFEDLFKKILDQDGDQKLQDVKSHFITPVNHTDVTIGDRPDHTKDLIMHGQHPSLEPDSMSLAIGALTRRKASHHSEHSRRSAIGNVPVLESPLKRTVRPRDASIPCRVHYRMVSAEVGIAIHDLPSLRDVVQSLGDAVKGKVSYLSALVIANTAFWRFKASRLCTSMAMFIAILARETYCFMKVTASFPISSIRRRWVRDLHMKLELYVSLSLQVRLWTLIYLRAQGTVYFMAIEIAMLRYFFRPTRRTDAMRLPFHYNPLHDLESIWWIMNYFLFHSFTVANHDQQALDHDLQILFPSNDDFSKRIHAFRDPDEYQDMLLHLPPSFQQLGGHMENCRASLCDRYIKAEAGSELDPSAFDEEIYRLFIDAFTSLYTSPALEQAVRKRPREEEGDAEEEEDLEEDEKDVLPKLPAKKGKSKRQKSR